MLSICSFNNCCLYDWVSFPDVEVDYGSLYGIAVTIGNKLNVLFFVTAIITSMLSFISINLLWGYWLTVLFVKISNTTDKYQNDFKVKVWFF